MSFWLGTQVSNGRDGTCEVVVQAAGRTQTFSAVNGTGMLLWVQRELTFVATAATTTLSCRCVQNANLHFAFVDAIDVSLASRTDVTADQAPLAFELEAVGPNPARGRAFTVRFTLPTAVPASLELLDVAGRRISTIEVGALGAGRHVRTLAGCGQAGPGIYFVRLTQGASAQTIRVAVLD